MLKDVKILLGISGGIAAYKVAELARLLIKEEAVVQVVMTKAARQFITPLTFQTLTGRPVYHSLFTHKNWDPLKHIDLSRDISLMVIAPATANVIGKIAAGIADDLLTTTVMAISCPVMIVPSMNTRMYESAAVQDNLKCLRRRGFIIIDPEEGELACGGAGKGRLPEPEVILNRIKQVLLKDNKLLTGKKVLVTAGPTQEPIDPVRFLSNYSTGKMGYSVAEAAALRGAEVFLVSGPTFLKPPEGVHFYKVQTAQEMFRKVMQLYEGVDVVIKAAAVSDYRPRQVHPEKVKKGKTLTLELVPNPDILFELGKRKGNKVLVGFAAETGDVISYAREKLDKKNLDLVIANDLTQEGAGFAVETNLIKIISKTGVEELPLMTKKEVAHRILDRVVEILARRDG